MTHITETGQASSSLCRVFSVFNYKKSLEIAYAHIAWFSPIHINFNVSSSI